MMRSTFFLFLLAAPVLVAQQPRPSRADVVRAHARWSHDAYRTTLDAATALQQRIEDLLREPDATRLTAARAAWVEAHRRYCRTEVLRFSDGPIEGIEPLLNAWPVDEVYIDALLADRERYPNLTPAVLEVANEHGGEANIATGWHAIEYLLWGRDDSADGPGDRPVTDLDRTTSALAERRGIYLRVSTELLCSHLRQLVSAWLPDRDNYRRRFEGEIDASLRRMLVGATVLTAFELGGERLTVAYETRDQENEHSCFSDATLVDLLANQQGLRDLLLGHGAGSARRPGLVGLLHETSPATAELLQQRIEAALARLAEIPAPFDQAILGADDAPSRLAIQRAILAMEAQAEALLIAGKHLGFELPLQPGGG